MLWFQAGQLGDMQPSSPPPNQVRGSCSDSEHQRPNIGGTVQDVTVPPPIGTVLYIKLRDDPTAINTAALPVLPNQQ